jgi:dimethylargininase
MFKHCIVRTPCRALVNGITSGLYPGTPDYELACRQHRHYIECLKQCGVQVEILPPLEEYPDSVFVEDPAVVTRSCAIIANPGAASRNGEKDEILPAIRKFYPDDRIHFITGEGRLDGGDVMMVVDHFYVGRSARTNGEGIRQFSGILARYGMTCSEVTLEEVLHLKTGVNYIENNHLLVCGEFVHKPEFERYNKLLVPEGEEYAANCIWMNGSVIVPDGYPGTARLVEAAGYRVILCDTSEFRKLDGGLSCMSLRF